MAIGCDTATKITSSRLNAIIAKRYTYIGRYLNYLKGYHDCLDLSEVQLISGKNINIISIYQDLGTTGASYFTARQAQIDVVEALSLAGQLNQPSRTPVYFAVDFDATDQQITSNIIPYFKSIYQTILDRQGNPLEYKLGVYGSGKVCTAIRSQIESNAYTMLANATGWSGYNTFTSWNVKQGSTISLSTGSGSFTVDQSESSSLGSGEWRV